MIIRDRLTNDELTKIVYEAIAAKHGITAGYVKGHVTFTSTATATTADIYLETTNVPPITLNLSRLT